VGTSEVRATAASNIRYAVRAYTFDKICYGISFRAESK
jgi:hypothetical protein